MHPAIPPSFASHHPPTCPSLSPPPASLPVLDRIVRSSRQNLGDLRPAISKLLVCLEQQILLFFRPGLFLDVGVQLEGREGVREGEEW